MRASGDYVHMWNAVYIDGQAKSIDVSSTRTDACFYLDVVGQLKCPFCDYRNVFGLRRFATLVQTAKRSCIILI